MMSFVHTIPVGLGLLCALLDWEHIIDSFGGGKHCPWVRNVSKMEYKFYPIKIILNEILIQLKPSIFTFYFKLEKLFRM